MATERIYALFQDVADAERAIGALQDHGIARDAIGVVARRAAEQDEAGRVRGGYARLADQTGLEQGEPETAYMTQVGTLPPAAIASTAAPTSSVDTPANVEAVGKEGLTTTTPQDALAGAAVGTGVGLVAGILAAAAAIAIPGFGLVLGGGALAAALGAAAATTAAGAVAGGVTGYLRDMGMPEPAAQRLADRISEGDYLLTIDADSLQYDDLKQLLTKYNAVGVDINGVAAGADIPPTATVVPAEEVTTFAPSVPVVPLPPNGAFDFPQAQLTDPVMSETPTAAHEAALMQSPAPRYPANPALAQETEPITEITQVMPVEKRV